MRVLYAVFLAITLCFSAALAQGHDAIPPTNGTETEQASEASAVETVLPAGGASIALILPQAFVLQGFESGTYLYESAETGAQFWVGSELDNRKDQRNLLRKLRDHSNQNVLFEDVLMGSHRFLAYYNQSRSWSWGFLLLTDDGYSYRFFYNMAAEQRQETIPDEAVAILSTVRLLRETEEAFPR